jgi:high-affinity nickel-transport protein
MSPMQRGRAIGDGRGAVAIVLAVIALHVAGLTLLFALVVPAHLELGDGAVFGAGLGLTAYTLGMRHAFDADHVAAIDGATRRLMSVGRRPTGVGFFFSLGHSTVVVLLAVMIAIGMRGLGAAVEDDGSTLHAVTGVIGPTVSGLFLLALGLGNLAVCAGIWRAVAARREGALGDDALDRSLARSGLLARLYSRATGGVRSAWQMYPVGLLFGLGFDTATEVALLATAGAAAAGGLPLYAILCLPLLFAAGMTLFDSINGALTGRAYGWALSRPARRAFYNLTVTAITVVASLTIAVIELAAVLADALDVGGGPLAALASIELADAGFALAAGFLVIWAAAVLIWRLARIEERWAG